MDFTTSQQVLDTIQASDDVERVRGDNRRKINDFLNGAPPLSSEEAKQMQLRVNVNWGEGPVLASHARRQYYNAFLSRNNFFRVNLPLAPPETQTEWSSFITRKINKIMKDSLPYLELYRSKFSSVVAHGIGPQMWPNSYGWRPGVVAVEDLRVATDTLISMENLEWFARRMIYTPGELADKVFGEYSSKHWNKEAAQKILKEYKLLNYDNQTYDWMRTPEKMAELWKQNLGYLSSDAVPQISLWHFYFKQRDKNRKHSWTMRILPEIGSVRGEHHDDFLYDCGTKPVAQELRHLLHIQFGDLSCKSPFLYHSVRSLGFLLMEPCFWTNLTRCRLLQHAWEHLGEMFRVSDPAARARAGKIELFDRCILPEGVQIVSQNERHQIDPDLIESVMAQLKQLMQEASVTYTQDLDTGTKKEQTATEIMAKMNQVNALMSGLLMIAFNYEAHAYKEICRRFCLSNSGDPDVREFQRDCKKFGIPRVYLNADQWDIDAEIPMGAGNPTMEQAMIQTLMQQRPAYDPTAQQEILHDFTVTVTGDPKKAARWVPLDKRRGVTDSQRDAEFAFAVLMQGVPVRMKEGLNQIDQIQTILGLMAGVVSRIEQTGNMATAGEIAGLKMAAQYVGGFIQLMAQNPQEKQRTNQYMQSLSKLMNTVKGFEQRLAQEAQKKAQEQNGAAETQAKAQAEMMLAQNKIRISQAEAKNKIQIENAKFQAEQRRKNMQTGLEEHRKTSSHIMGEDRAVHGHVLEQHRATHGHVMEEGRKDEAHKAEVKRKARLVSMGE